MNISKAVCVTGYWTQALQLVWNKRNRDQDRLANGKSFGETLQLRVEQVVLSQRHSLEDDGRVEPVRCDGPRRQEIKAEETVTARSLLPILPILRV